MKIRKGFVSNSSSSSFICDVCGNIESGWDMSIDEAYMYECEKEHTFCQNHIVNKEVYEKWAEKMDEYDRCYDIPTECCPICTMKNLKQEDALKYLLKYNNIDMKHLLLKIKANYKNYEEFRSDIKDEKSR